MTTNGDYIVAGRTVNSKLKVSISSSSMLIRTPDKLNSHNLNCIASLIIITTVIQVNCVCYGT